MPRLADTDGPHSAGVLFTRRMGNITQRGLTRAELKTFRLGQIAEAAVRLEAAARQALVALRQEHEDEVWKAPPQVAVTLDACRAALVERRDLEETVVADGQATITQAIAAYKERNRYMHDVLADTGAAWDRVNMDRTRANRPEDIRVDEEHMSNAHRDLLAAGWRLRALKAVVEAVNHPQEGPHYRSGWRDLLTGRFSVAEDGTASWSNLDQDDDGD